MSEGSAALNIGAIQPDMIAASEARSGTLARTAAVWLLLLGVTIGQRFCVPFGTSQIPISAFIAYAALYLLLTSGRARVNATALILYGAVIVSLVVTLFFGKVFFSTFSFFYLILLYFVYLFSTDVTRSEYLGYLKIYQNLMIGLAIIALAQFVEQLTLHTTMSLFDLVPENFQLIGYNTRPTLFYGSAFYKANADFFLEPSFLSQYMAVAIIIEILFFGSWKRIALYGAAIFVSFSGTGMVLLLLFAVATVIRTRRWAMLYPLPFLVILLVIFQDNQFVTAIVGRLGEFDDTNTSAFMRFIGPNEVLTSILGPDFGAFLVGRGPGFVEDLNRGMLGAPVNFPVIHKMLLEYGIVGTLPFMAFILHRFFAGSRSKLLSAAALLMYLFLSGSLLQPHTIFLFYVLVILMPMQAGETVTRNIAKRDMPRPLALGAAS
jgi:hypothetical protein